MDNDKRMLDLNNILNEAKKTPVDPIKLLDNLNAASIDLHSAIVKLDEWTYHAEPGAMPQKNVKMVADLRKAYSALHRVVHRTISGLETKI